MPFQNYICWRKELIKEVLDVDALQSNEKFFLATHHPIIMRDVKNGNLIDENEFLEKFLNKDESHLHFAVVGTAGTGKSHLIRWLYINIPKTDNRKVVLIPKVGTNLRDIIKTILQGMEGTPFDEFREKIDTATSALTPDMARERLRNELAIAVGKKSTHFREEPLNPYTTDDLDYLMEYLPEMIYDGALRNVFLSEGGVIDRLSKLVTGSSERERLDRRREFDLDDFRPEEWHINKAELGAKAFDMYKNLVDDEYFRILSKWWINKNLDEAVRQVLNLDADDLGRVMFDMREKLAEQNIELIILMEDFAKLEGIDRPLLEALLVRPKHGDRTLCKLSSAMAVTTGYYDQLEETVKQRINLVVDMDIDAPIEQEDYKKEINLFAARYLNAIRLKEQQLQEWNTQTTGDQFVPSGCESCPHMSVCHDVFGEEKGMGVYPFNPQALQHMCVSPESMGIKRFNPRFLIDNVIKHTLVNYGDDIGDGNFPSIAVLGGRAEMSALNKKTLSENVPPDKVNQYRTLIEVWGDPGTLTSIPEELYTAFGLNPLKTGGRTKPPPSTPTTTKPPPPTTEPTDKLQNDLLELDEWANGEHLSQDFTQELRQTLLEHLSEYIDWDNEMLVEEYYSNETAKAFCRNSLNFQRQDTRGGQASVHLELPLNNDFDSTALALQGMLYLKHYKVWDFENSERLLPYFINLLDALSNEILSQLRKLSVESTIWDPVPAIIELLVIGATMMGKPTSAENDIENYIDSTFHHWEDVTISGDSQRSSSWQQLIRSYIDFGPHLVDILKSRTACTKGGVLTAQVIDAATMIKPIKEIITSWQPSQIIPDDIRTDYKYISRLRRSVDNLLEKAIKEEEKRYLNWLTEIRERIPSGTECNKVAEEVQQIYLEAFNAAVLPTETHMATIEKMINDFKDSGIDDVLDGIAELNNNSDLFKCLPILGRDDYIGPMEIGKRFVGNVSNFITAVNQRIDSEVADSTLEGNVLDIQKSIGEQLEDLSDMMDAVKRGG